MAESKSATEDGVQEAVVAASSGMTRTYAYIWDNFAAWCEASGRASLPAATEDVADHIRERADAGARPSTLRVTAAAIARRHTLAELDNPCESETVQLVLEEFTQGATPGPRRVLPLDMDCYRAIRETAHEPRRSRGGVMESSESARRRGALDVAMIGLMRDAQLKVREATNLTWADIEQLPDGTGRVTVPAPAGRRKSREAAAQFLDDEDACRPGALRQRRPITESKTQPHRHPDKPCRKAGGTWRGIRRRESPDGHARRPGDDCGGAAGRVCGLRTPVSMAR